MGRVVKGHQPAGTAGAQPSGRAWLMAMQLTGAEDAAVNVSVSGERGPTCAERAAVNRGLPKGVPTNGCRKRSRQGERGWWPHGRWVSRAQPST